MEPNNESLRDPKQLDPVVEERPITAQRLAEVAFALHPEFRPVIRPGTGVVDTPQRFVAVNRRTIIPIPGIQ